MDSEMAKMMAQLGQYKKQLDHEAGPIPPNKAQTQQLQKLESKLSNMEGQVKVVRQEEQANVGNAAESAQLLQKERQLVEEEGVARDQMQAAKAVAQAKAEPKKPEPQDEQHADNNEESVMLSLVRCSPHCGSSLLGLPLPFALFFNLRSPSAPAINCTIQTKRPAKFVSSD